MVFVSGGKKIEAGGLRNGDAVWWDTDGNKSVACIGPELRFCMFNKLSRPTKEDLRKLVENSAGITPKNLKFVSVEGMAVKGDHNWVGVRKYEKANEHTVYWTAIVDHKGELAWGGGMLDLERKPFAISDLYADNSGLWVTLSYENENGEKKEDVDGRLAWIKLSDEDRLQRMHLCMDPNNLNNPLVLNGKPVGITAYGDNLVVVYDSDKDRKEGKQTGGKGFPLHNNQDYLEVVSKPDCSAGPELKTK